MTFRHWSTWSWRKSWRQHHKLVIYMNLLVPVFICLQWQAHKLGDLTLFIIASRCNMSGAVRISSSHFQALQLWEDDATEGVHRSCGIYRGMQEITFSPTMMIVSRIHAQNSFSLRSTAFASVVIQTSSPLSRRSFKSLLSSSYSQSSHWALLVISSRQEVGLKTFWNTL